MADPIEDILRPASMSDRVKASAWDVFHQSQNADELRGALDALPLPPEVKAALMQAKSPDEGSALGRFASGAGEMLNPVTMAKGLYQAARHPIDTGTAMLGAQGDQLSQAVQMAREGRYSEAAGHGVAGLVPLVGPVAADVGEQIGSGDVAGGLGAASGLLTPFGVPSAVRGARRVVPAGVRDRLASSLERGAANRITDVIAPKVGANKTRLGNRAAAIAPQLAKDPDMVAWSREGLHGKVTAALDDASRGLDDAAEARPPLTTETDPIVRALQEKQQALTSEAVEGSRLVPSVVSEGAREVPVNVGRRYALQWMRADMDNLPFTKRTFNEASKGGGYDVVAGAAGAPIYRAIIGAEGRELISATRADVLRAIDDVLAGKTEGHLRELVTGVADDLARGDQRTQKLMATGPPDASDLGPLTEYQTLAGKKAGPPSLEARPIGQGVVPGPNQARSAPIQQAIAEVQQLGPVAKYESLRRLRQAYDQPAKAKYNPSLTADYLKVQGEASGAADVAGVLREQLAKMDPKTATANAKYSLMKTAKDVLDATAEVERVRPRVGRQIMARLTGSLIGQTAAGPAGAVGGYVLGPVMDSLMSSAPTTQLQTARIMSKLAAAVRRGDVDQVNVLMVKLKRYQAQGAVVVGRATSPSESPTGTEPAWSQP